jgi:hypothetical protein
MAGRKVFWTEEHYDALFQGYTTNSGYTEDDGLVRFRVEMTASRKFWVASAARLVTDERGLFEIGWHVLGTFVNATQAKRFLEESTGIPSEGLPHAVK